MSTTVSRRIGNVKTMMKIPPVGYMTLPCKTKKRTVGLAIKLIILTALFVPMVALYIR
jgi:hypothetical protein